MTTGTPALRPMSKASSRASITCSDSSRMWVVWMAPAGFSSSARALTSDVGAGAAVG
jgi:hypothetical protein